MDNYTKLYWLTRLDALNSLFAAMIIISGIALLFYFIFSSIGLNLLLDDDDAPQRFKFVPRWFVPLLLIGSLGGAFIPTKNEMIFIVAGGKTMDFVQSDSSLSKIPYQTTQIISEYLDKQLKETKEESK